MNDILFSPTQFGAIELKNRVVMAPMTRSRAGEGDVPTELAVEYYRQRASAGLIITEGTQPSDAGKGYCRTPGIYSPEQVEGWRRVTEAVASEGGLMVSQIMHVGRISSRHNKQPDSETVAPSAIQAAGQMFTDSHGMVDFDVPRALATSEIADVVEEYRQATENAFAAGFAGVELHATSGYLPAQFLSTGTNQRTDHYGGAAQNRIRFVLEVLEAMTAVDGADRVGMRICPGNPFNDLHDDDPQATFTALLQAVDPMQLAYLHVIRMPEGPVDNLALAREYFSGPLLVNESYSADEAAQTLQRAEAAAVSFARHYIANPDLVERFKAGAELARFDHKTLYTPGAKGYTDY
ncbi:MAG: alkene reductase [Gammaproteobacteria bacterium]|nr:alkene reductase [Gammaproteobacteria bacterium]